MDQAIPVEDQAVRKRKTRQETVILTWGVSQQSAGGWKVEGGRCPYLEVRVRVSTEDDDEEAADGETLDTEPDWERTVLHTLSVPHVTSLPHLAL